MTELKKLLTVKSLVTLVLTAVFAILLLLNQQIPQEFVMVYNTVIAFYFGTQYQKQEEKINKEKADK